jgi:hypothetical protein
MASSPTWVSVAQKLDVSKVTSGWGDDVILRIIVLARYSSPGGTRSLALAPTEATHFAFVSPGESF